MTTSMLRGRGLGIAEADPSAATRHLTTYYNAANVAATAAPTSETNDFVSTAKDYADLIKTSTTDLTNTDPREWTSTQYLGVATGFVSLWTLVVMICLCKGCCERRRRNQRTKVDNSYMNMTFDDNKKALLDQNSGGSYQYKMDRPIVVRGRMSTKAGTGSSDDPVLISPCFGAGVEDFDALDPNRLPLGARLHGANKLRRDGLTGQGVRVAIIDSGIDHRHPGLHDKVRTKRWFRHGTSLQEDDHGTHVAGTVHFVAPDADLFDYRVFGNAGDFSGDVAIAKSIRSAVDIDKCHVINLSLRCSYPVLPEIKKAVRYARRKGVHMVCAAGNSGDGKPQTDEIYTYPAFFDETISVAAVCKDEGLPPTSFSESNSKVSFSAIGRDVVSLKPGGGMQFMSGTSMAAPHVTGLIACLLSNNPTKYNNYQLRKVLRDKYAIDIASKGYDKQTGSGFVSYLADGGTSDDELFDLLALV
eukprot:jgi/Psemu1/305254/fgenesh1_kg.188_\